MLCYELTLARRNATTTTGLGTGHDGFGSLRRHVKFFLTSCRHAFSRCSNFLDLLDNRRSHPAPPNHNYAEHHSVPPSADQARWQLQLGPGHDPGHTCQRHCITGSCNIDVDSCNLSSSHVDALFLATPTPEYFEDANAILNSVDTEQHGLGPYKVSIAPSCREAEVMKHGSIPLNIGILASESSSGTALLPDEGDTSNDNTLACPHGCSQTFSRAGEYRRHMKKHDPNQLRYPCTELGCLKSFYRKDKLRDHLRQGHKLP